MTTLKSEGCCFYCGQLYDKRSIGKHLDAHLTQFSTGTTVPGTLAFHVRVEAADMFLELLVDANATLTKVDKFLRKIWLECCGHGKINRRSLRQHRVSAQDMAGVLRPPQRVSAKGHLRRDSDEPQGGRGLLAGIDARLRVRFWLNDGFTN